MHIKHELLYYAEKNSTIEYTSKPQGSLNVSRMVQGFSDCWSKLTAAATLKKKTIIFADWWAEFWDEFMLAEVHNLFSELLADNFIIYVWNAPRIELLKEYEFLPSNSKFFLNKIKPEFKDVLVKQAMEQLKLPKDSLLIVQRAELLDLLGRKNDVSWIDARYIGYTTHNIDKIKKIEASQPSTFHNIRISERSLRDNFVTIQYLQEQCIINWSDTPVIESENLMYLHHPSSSMDVVTKVGQNTIENNITPLIAPPSEISLIGSGLDDIINPLQLPSLVEANIAAFDTVFKEDNLCDFLTDELKGLKIQNIPTFNIDVGTLDKLTFLQYRYTADNINMLYKLLSLAPHLKYLHTAGMDQTVNFFSNDIFLSELNVLIMEVNELCLFKTLDRTPALKTLWLKDVCFDNDSFLFYHDFRQLNQLNTLIIDSLSIPYLTAGVDVLLSKAIHCKNLALSYVMSNNIKSSLLTLPNLESFCVNQFDAFVLSLIQAATSLKHLSILFRGELCALPPEIFRPTLESLDLNVEQGTCTASVISSWLNIQPHLKILSLECKSLSLDLDLISVLRIVKKIHLKFRDRITPKDLSIPDNIIIDLPNVESISLVSAEDRVLNTLFQCCSALKSLKVMYFIKNDINQWKIPSSIESVTLQSAMPMEQLKVLLKALPNLRFLMLDYETQRFVLDSELQELLSKIEIVNMPNLCESVVQPTVNNTHIQQNTSEPAPQTYWGSLVSSFTRGLFGSSDSVDKSTNAAVTKTRGVAKFRLMDLDTKPDLTKQFNLQRIFYATSGIKHPEPNLYRLEVYDSISFLNQQFVLEHKNPLDLVPVNIIQVIDLYQLNKAEIKGKYFGKQVFNLNSVWQPIASLTPQDRITHYHLSISSGYQIQYSHRDNLYYIRSTQGSIEVTLDFLLETRHNRTPSIIDPDVQKWIDTFSSFGSGELLLNDGNLTADEILRAMIQQKVGACRHRAVAFKALMAKLYPELAVRVVENDCHMFVEILQQEKWITCNLGGYPAEMNISEFEKQQAPSATPPQTTSSQITYHSSQQIMFEQYFETWVFENQANSANPAIYIQSLLNGIDKKQLIHLPLDSLMAFNLAIQSQALRTGHQVFYINSPEDLVCSAPFVVRQGNKGVLHLRRDGGGALYDFLTTTCEHVNTPILIVNYNNFSADFIVRFNGLLDEKRHADGTPLPSNAVIIGLIDPKKPDAYNGEDFYSRFDKREQCPLMTFPEMLSLLQPLSTNVQNPIIINLYHSKNWLMLLMGGWCIDNGELLFEVGSLNHETLASGRHIIIQNPPQDPMFEFFWQQARITKQINYAGEVYPVTHDLELYTSDGYDWDELLNCVNFESVELDNLVVLNPSTLGDFFNQYKFNTDNVFSRMPGLLAQNKTNILLTRALNLDEWAMFLNAVKTHNLHVNITCAPGVALPAGWNVRLKTLDVQPWDKNLIEDNLCIVTQDPFLTVASIATTRDTLILDISECTASDLLIHLSARVENLKYIFSQTENAVLSALKQGRQVILTGNFSDELLDELAAFIIQHQYSGRLILISKEPIGFMPNVQHQFTEQEKYDALLARGFTSDEINAQNLATDSFVILVTKLLYCRQHPNALISNAWDGLYNPQLVHNLTVFNPDTSAEDAKDFINNRLLQFNQALANGPYVFLAGLTGVGKSSFIANELKDRQIFYGETAILDWINAAPGLRPTLFLDEANLSNRQWTEFEGLFVNPPGVLVEGKYYLVSPEHKVVFAGNPLSYGDERKVSSLFQHHGNSLVFEPLSIAFIYETTLKPILQDTFDEFTTQLIAQELLAVYSFLIEISRDEVLISPRQMQMMALSVVEYHERFPHVPIRDLAKFHARHIAVGLVPAIHHGRFNQQFSEISREHLLGDAACLPPSLTNFHVTSSRKQVLWQLTDFLSLREFRRAKNIAQGGLQRFVLEGAPGLGKSEMIYSLMDAYGLKEASLHAEIILNENVFYQIHASQQADLQEEILLKAFDAGALVIINEINSMPTLEKLLNSLLDGKHPKEGNRRPLKAGFGVLGTQNPPDMSGRRMESPALENRTQKVKLLPYTADEMHIILEKMGISSTATRNDIISAFQLKVKEAQARHLSPAPSFRDVINLAKSIMQAHSRVVVLDNDKPFQVYTV